VGKTVEGSRQNENRMDGEIQSKRYMYMYENRIMKPVGSYFKK
jgi:hypothetical protein